MFEDEISDGKRATSSSADERLYPEADAPRTKATASRLDNAENTALHGKLLSYYRQEVDRQRENRIEMATDADFYDHIQWTQEDADVLRERGQAPLTYNVLAQSINWIIGTEKRGRTDFKVFGRTKEDSHGAQLKTELLKYVSDVNRMPFSRSAAFEDAAKVGVGWLEDGLNGEPEDGEIIESRHESWRNMLWDSASIRPDLSDCRYVIRSKWLDVDVAQAQFPERSDQIDQDAEDGASIAYDMEDGDDVMDQVEMERNQQLTLSSQSMSHTRRRVKLMEIWFRRPTPVKRMIGGKLAGRIYDESNPAHVAQVQAGATLRASTSMAMHCAIITHEHMLWVGKSPYRHDKFPFTPIWCFRRDRDNLPYGYIRGMRDIQQDVNKRMSKALAILSSNKVIMDAGAVDDLDALADQVSDPNGIIEKKKGYELKIDADRELAPAHLDLMSRNISMIQQVSGVTDEQLGRQTNASSGKAVLARQDQGMLATSKIYDNLRFAVQIQGEKVLSMIEQFFTDEKSFRITNDRGYATFKTVNDTSENDITATQADFVVGEAEWRTSMRGAAAEQLGDLMNKLPPNIVTMILDLVIESMDIANRDEIVRRIRQATGMKDPDADPDAPPSEEDIQAQQNAAKQQQMQDAMAEAQTRKVMAEAAKAEAGSIDARLNAQQKAVLVARDVILTPRVADVADNILADAGWTDVQQPPQPEPTQAQMGMQIPEQQPAGMPPATT